MKLLDFLKPAEAYTGRSGPLDKIVLTSRVRLARNLDAVSFPGHSKKAQRVKALESLLPAVSGLEAMKGGAHEGMGKLSAMDKQILVERHLISREHAARGVGSAVVVSKDELISVMINEEDHLRMQVILPGLQVKEAWEKLDAFDSLLENVVPYAFSPKYGYLTACPTNLGTGIRVSAMLHLPGLVLAEHINQIITSVNKLGLAVRGLYGEGTEALGNVFQVSNQMTLGESEVEIVEKLNKVSYRLLRTKRMRGRRCWKQIPKCCSTISAVLTVSCLIPTVFRRKKPRICYRCCVLASISSCFRPSIGPWWTSCLSSPSQRISSADPRARKRPKKGMSCEQICYESGLPRSPDPRTSSLPGRVKSPKSPKRTRKGESISGGIKQGFGTCFFRIH